MNSLDNSKIKVRIKSKQETPSVKKEVIIPEITEPESIQEEKNESGVVRQVIYPEKPAEEREVPVISENEIFSQTGDEAQRSEEIKSDKPKNIIFYFTDQQRYDTFNEEIMPNLCEISREGISFENCFTCQPVCGPARACLQTGVYATQSGCYRNGISLPRDMSTLADFFNEAGYDTAYIGKWHLASDKDYKGEKEPVPEERRGGYRYWRASDILEFTSHGYDGYVFDENGERIDFSGYRADCINDFALEYLDSRDKSKPFFMFVSQLEPHHQNDRRRFEGFNETVEDFRDYPVPEDLTFLKGNYDKHYPDYLSAIHRVDHNLGRLVAKLKDEGIYDDTVIIFTSDHGCHFKTRNAEYKRSCHDSSIHVPLVIRGGAYTGGFSDEKLVSLIDLPATILSIADIDIPDYFMGRDILRDREREAVYIQISESQCARAIRTHEYTYCVAVSGYGAGFAVADSPVYTEEYLYDNVSDPLQMNNLIREKDYKIVRSAMRKLLLKQMEEAEGKKALILPNVITKRK